MLSMYLNYHFMNFFRNQNAVLLDFDWWVFWGLSKLNHSCPMDHSLVISLSNVLRASSKKFFKKVCQNCFLSSLIERGAKTPFLRSDGILLRCTFLNTFRSLSWNFSAGLSKLLSTCPKYIFWENFSDFARNTSGRWTKVFQQGFKTAFCREFSLTILEHCFSAFALIIVAICQQKELCQSLQNFNSRGRKTILVIFFRYEQRFFGIWGNVLGTLARTSFHVSMGLLAK